jgi:superfamily II DNA or RNA helicase
MSELFDKKFEYPDVNDPDLQYKLYKKKEFFSYRIPERIELDDYDKIKKYREKQCTGVMTLHPYQSFVANFINPSTPYTGILVMHGLGSGKTCSAINIAEGFKSLVQKYNTKIHILIPGPIVKKMWSSSLISCTGETYRKYVDKSIYMSDEEKERIDKNAISQALQFYKFMTYRNFMKKVLGDKIVDRKVVSGQKTKVSYKRTEEGEYERDVAIDRLYSLSNTVLIIDEAHHMAGNSYGEALKMILNHKDSVNLKLVLLTATPMKNLASEIIDLMNFLRPKDSPIERDKIFTSATNHLMEIKPGGLEYFKKMINGYVSHVRGSDPIIYAKRVDKGVIPEGLLFTKVIKCMLEPFQKEAYLLATKEEVEDTLDRKSEAVANFTFPILSSDKKSLIGSYGKDGLNILKNQIKIYHDELNKKIATTFFEGKQDTYISLAEDGKKLIGKILKYPNLRFFSVKFNRVLKKISKLVWGKKGSQTVFIYSNLVKVGITLFSEILVQNGYLEYQEDFSNYHFDNDTVCYYCGITHGEHNKISRANKTNKTDNSLPPPHNFAPATFITVTGKLGEEEDLVQEDKKRLIDNVFNNINNYDGKNIKFLLGSKVMSEGISLKNVGQVHILDVHYNLGNIDQAIGRAIRYCSHYSLMSETNVYPEVAVYKYVISLPDKLTTEEELYQKAELKHIIIKKMERAMKENAIDCPLNVAGNMFKEEIEIYKDCDKKGVTLCPSQCDYTSCQYECSNLKLNKDYYDPSRNIYKIIERNKLDYSTYNYEMSKSEIEYVKSKIKEMYVLNYIYTLDQIIEYVKEAFVNYKKDLFDNFFVYKALDDMIPITENDMNNYKDTIVDKYNRRGYLIYRNKYYIFQSDEQNENVPIYYRKNYMPTISNNISLYNYLQTTLATSDIEINKKLMEILETETRDKKDLTYNFDDVFDYYEINRTEWTYVGIIEKNPKGGTFPDIFKLRPKRDKILLKKRGTGISSYLGSACGTAKNKNYLKKVAKELEISYDPNESRDSICNLIKNKLLFLEKYQTGDNKITYMIIPLNNPNVPFPYNLEDRTKYIINDIKKELSIKFNFSIKTIKKTEGVEKNYPSFIITLNLDPSYLNKINSKYNPYIENNTIKILVE